MGHSAVCWLGSFYVGETKGDIDVGLMQLMRSSDKNVVRAREADLPFQMHQWTEHVDADDNEDVSVVYYRAPLPVIRDRLELRGYTLEIAKSALALSLRHDAARYRKMSVTWSERSIGKAFQSDARLLEATDVEDWLAALREIRTKGLERQDLRRDPSTYDGTLIGYMLGNDWYGYSGPDLNVGLRLALEVCAETDEFIYDVTDLILGECFSADDDLVDYALGLSASDYSSSGKIIILTEGRTDSWIISESLQLLYPHLADYFSFMDFEGARVGGGAGNLANIVKAFAGAGVVNKVIALFDNDTAADTAIQGLRSVRLPRNIRVQKLPDSSPLQSYPTIGPSGSTLMNINGMAASIELYLGADILTESTGDLAPVQWTGYEAGLGKYQGEVLFKDKIHERFRQRLEACRADSALVEKKDWSSLRHVLSTLFVAFHDTDGAEICAQLKEYFAQ